MLLVLALTASGCGGDPEQAPPPPGPAPALSESDRAAVLALESRLQRHCLRVARSLVDPAAAPTPEQTRAAFAAADRLVARVVQSPRAPFGAGQDLRLFLADVVENMEGSNCDPRLVAHLERGLAGIPVE